MLLTLRSWWRRPRPSRLSEQSTPCAASAGCSPAAETAAAHRAVDDAADQPLVIDTMLAQERYCLLLRPQVAVELSDEQYGRARTALERSMASVPGGPVELCFDETHPPAEEPPHVESFLLDRYPVTNRQFRQFMEAGGYSLPALWEPEAAAALSELVDQTGMSGPRFWRGGLYAAGEDDHPVIGVSWYEASAYARWSGKRLPAECEWLKAAAWPVRGADGRISQRRFPWGDCMDWGRCNVWGSGLGKTTSVRQFAAGVSVGGVYQLIGNVWEWTSGDFNAVDAEDQPLELLSPLRAIRGGAYDTYFEQQACCAFRSGERPFSRKHNIGFRCALCACDVAGPRPEAEALLQGASQ